MADRILTKDFYVYLHRKATTGEVFYVGKGHGRRATVKERSSHWLNVYKKHGFVVEFVKTGLQEWAAFELESELIALYGRMDLNLGTLVNHTDGGDGVCGLVHKQYVKDRVRQANLGHTRNRGRVLSVEHKRKISESLKGNTRTKGHKQTEIHKMKVRIHQQTHGNPNSKKVIHNQTGFIFRSCADAIRWLSGYAGIESNTQGFASAIQVGRAYKGQKFSFIEEQPTIV